MINYHLASYIISCPDYSFRPKDNLPEVVFLGRSNVGKSTLFKILTGELDYDEGEISIAPGHRMGLISQIPVYPEGCTVEAVLETAFQRVRRIERDSAFTASSWPM